MELRILFLCGIVTKSLLKVPQQFELNRFWRDWEDCFPGCHILLVCPRRCLAAYLSAARLSRQVKRKSHWTVLKFKRVVSHFRLVHSGATTFESNRRIHSYNLGWRQNWREVMGYNWRMALVWPGAKSKLPHNGVEWDTQNTWRLEAPKNRWD